MPFGLWKRKKQVEPSNFDESKIATIDLTVMNGNGNVALASIKEEQEEEQSRWILDDKKLKYNFDLFIS